MANFIEQIDKEGQFDPIPALPIFKAAEEEKKKKKQENTNEIGRNLQKLLDTNAPASLIDSYMRDVEGIDLSRATRQTEDVTFTSAAKSAGRGAIRAVEGIASIPALGLEAITSIMSYGANKKLLDAGAPTEVIEAFNRKISPLGVVNRTSNAVISTLGLDRDESKNPAFVNQTVEKVVEYGIPTRLLTAGLTSGGKKLLASGRKNFNFIERTMLEAARDPKSFNRIEQGFSAIAAVSGQAAVAAATANVDPEDVEGLGWLQFGAELGSIGLGVVGQRLLSKIKDITTSKLILGAEHRERAATIKVSQFLNEISEADPTLLKNLELARTLEKEVGTTFTTDSILQNPNIDAALAGLIRSGSTTATRYARTLESIRERVITFENTLRPMVAGKGDLKAPIRKFLDEEINKIDSKIEAAVRKASDEAAAISPGRSVDEIGDSAIEYLRVLEEEDMAKVTSMYNKLDNSAEFSVKKIQQGIAKASVSKKVLEANKVRLAQGLDPIDGLAGREFGAIPRNILDLAEINFGAGVKRANLLKMREFREVVNSEIRIAQRSGDSDTVSRLIHMRDGVDGAIKGARGALNGNAKTILSEANDFYQKVLDKYDRGFASAILNKDLMGRSRLAPEDFVNFWVRKGKDSVRVTDDYKNAFGESPIAKTFIRDSIANTLSKFKKADGRLDSRRIEKWLLDHESNLKGHGVWDNFSDLTKAENLARQAEELGSVSKKDLEDGILGAIVKTGNVKRYLQTQLDNGTLNKVGAIVKATKDPAAAKAFNRNVFDMVLNKSKTSAIDASDQIIRDPTKLIIALNENEKILRGALGDAHFENLKKLSSIWKFTEGVRPGVSAATPDISIHRNVNQDQLGKAASKIRASLQGFVSKEFTAIQLANQFFDIVSTHAAQRILEDAMFDVKFAAELVEIGKNFAGKRAIRAIGTAAAPISLEALEDDDARTKLN